ncbi:hypothetical protein HN371_01655 [Candidatus Poribacteria bacterium]|jgi:hypothetical protein|nr:hypothetical protein [Candidatus Poribacteria bacterium]MBT5534295.1 hypothetical protein [Candidatus Poribacteria bacterium]MBT7100170.1 hypothetical protein [Candidatus Poribacteria bacterium]MBT7807748.1 hypothetical protein [Candidatus Poribacteria bacterium]
MGSPLTGIATFVLVIALGCSAATAPPAGVVTRAEPPQAEVPTSDRVPAGVRLTQLAGATPADTATAPNLTYPTASSPLFIHTTDRNTVEGRVTIATVRGDTDTETGARLRSVQRLRKALRGSRIVDVDISTDRAQPIGAIATSAHILLTHAPPQAGRVEAYARQLARYAQSGGPIVGAVPRYLAQQGTWRELPADHPLLSAPYRIDVGRTGIGARALAIDDRVVAIHGRYNMASDGRLTADAAKRWANLFAYVAGPRHGGMSLARTRRPSEEGRDPSIAAPKYLRTLRSTPNLAPRRR